MGLYQIKCTPSEMTNGSKFSHQCQHQESIYHLHLMRTKGIISINLKGVNTRTDGVEIYKKDDCWYSTKRLPFVLTQFTIQMVGDMCYTQEVQCPAIMSPALLFMPLCPLSLRMLYQLIASTPHHRSNPLGKRF